MRALLACLTAAMLCASDVQAGRVEIPIYQTIGKNGTIRYSVPIRIGATGLSAMLDTASIGMRVLPGILGAGDYELLDTSSTYSYGSGARLDGKMARGRLSLGDASGTVQYQAVQSLGCADLRPHCPTNGRRAEEFGFGEDGRSDQGFKAILGTNLSRAEVENPLMAMGFSRWIVIVPRPDDSEPGRLILDPSDDEVAGYTLFRVSGSSAPSVSGCLISNAKPEEQICGRVLFDTGAPGMWIVSAYPPLFYPWPRGTVLDLVVKGEGQSVSTQFVANTAPSYSLHLRRVWKGPASSIFGAAPFLSYAVLYDAKNRKIGLKAR